MIKKKNIFVKKIDPLDFVIYNKDSKKYFEKVNEFGIFWTQHLWFATHYIEEELANEKLEFIQNTE